MTFAVNNDLVGLDLGVTQSSNANGSEATDNMWINASKSSGDWSANLLYLSNSSDGDDAVTSMGLDFAYSAMGGALDLNLSYNTEDEDGEMMDISGTYSVNDDMSLTAGMASIGENGFTYAGSGNMSANGWMNGNIGTLSADFDLGELDDEGNAVMTNTNANMENLYVGGSYTMGDFSLAATMSTVTNTEVEGYERSVTDISVGYSLNDNASLSYRMVSDATGDNEDLYNWLTLTVTP